MSESENGSGAGEFLSTETGARMPKGSVGRLLLVIPFLWSLFQIWYSSPLPFIVGFGIFNSTEARAIHLGFAIFLAFMAFPALKRSPRDHVPLADWALALLATASVMYLVVFYEALSQRPGNPTWYDIVVALSGIVLLLEATRRALGPPLMVVALVFLAYVLGGQYAPDVIAHDGASLGRVASHMWLTTEGVFGVALGVSTDFVFLFVLFGALLERAGAGAYFIKVAFAMLGRYRGGPAKAAVVASGLSGIISGSSIANVVTTGTFTIPLMKRVGFPGTKAGAVEVAASTNGQLTPPVMGAAAFLMVEYVGIPYLQVIQHAILPALISYIALLYMVHLEAVKLGMEPMRGPARARLLVRLTLIASNILGIIALSLAVYYGVGWTKDVFGAAAAPIVGAVVIAAYVALVWLAARQPTLEDKGTDEDLVIPPLGPTVRAGLYFLLPVAVLIWCLMVERFSPGLSAFWAVMFMIAISLTHRPLLAFFQRDRTLWAATRQGVAELADGMIGGARNMIGIGVATATAGIVVGTVTLTGIGLVMTEFVEFISGGNLMLILFFVALLSLILGMGLPTTANYIVVSTLMAPVVVELGAQNGLVVPLIAVHMFVFYFGILADDTPPVGLAAFAASAISGADPIRTGIQGFAYDIRTAILPFMFIFNTQILLIGLTGWVDLVITVVSATLAMLVFSAATQGYWLTRSRWYETAALLLITFTLFRPGFWWDDIYPPYENVPGTEIFEVMETIPAGGNLAVLASGMTIEGNEVSKTVLIPLEEPPGDPQNRLRAAGLSVMTTGGQAQVQNVRYGSQAQRAGLDFGFTIDAVRLPADRPPKELATIPAFLLLGAIGWAQHRRRQREGEPAPNAELRGAET
ncbi:TRAP transporter permease [Spiribacter halobius]|uniref:C4-dicarboxylate ABC transporter n=1 Tax=Sediminicurvatus halobius TaxID=2182432 RepID=A0A2U2N015_9GAMM|nr:TRAP transporter permease [Spiribacter halobius]PWG62470.1 C4-dicarboxylate ABC transporter [Spiribacter halobius]UEX78560.1 TRAP transporter permease [Spiribacter halobius]